MMSINLEEEKIKELERTFEEFYQKDPVAEANNAVKQAIDKFNNWVEKESKELEGIYSELKQKEESIRTLEKEIEEFDRMIKKEVPNPNDEKTILRYNQLVEERNALVQKYKKLAQEYEGKMSVYNKRIDDFNKEVKKRRDKLEEIKKEAKEKIAVYQEWLANQGPEKFYSDLNEFYASLQKRKREGEISGKLQEYIQRTKKIRTELGIWAKRKEEAKDGFLIVEAKICEEDSYLIVDNGASVCSISPEMVKILGIEDYVGEEVDIILPNMVKIKAPQLLIPKISVEGKKAQFVIGVVLKGTIPEVDGCLGLSFLNRFNYTIRRGRPQNLSLTPFTIPDDFQQFNIFISHNSKDLTFAEEVFNFLEEEGYAPFLSEKSLSQINRPFPEVINAVLESARYLIVVGSSKENIMAPWVRSEWMIFDNLIKSGQKEGNIISILCGKMKPQDLPGILSIYNAISINDENWGKTLINYLNKQ